MNNSRLLNVKKRIVARLLIAEIRYTILRMEWVWIWFTISCLVGFFVKSKNCILIYMMKEKNFRLDAFFLVKSFIFAESDSIWQILRIFRQTIIKMAAFFLVKSLIFTTIIFVEFRLTNFPSNLNKNEKKTPFIWKDCIFSREIINTILLNFVCHIIRQCNSDSFSREINDCLLNWIWLDEFSVKVKGKRW